MSTEVFGFGLRLCAFVFLRRGCQQTGEGSVKVEECEPKGNLDGFLARLHAFPQNEGLAARQNDQVWKEGSCRDVG